MSRRPSPCHQMYLPIACITDKPVRCTIVLCWMRICPVFRSLRILALRYDVALHPCMHCLLDHKGSTQGTALFSLSDLFVSTAHFEYSAGC